jgi:hypothetical protein
MKQNANSNGSFMTLMKLKTTAKQNSDTMKMKESESFSKMKIVVRLRQDSAVTSYSLNWKRGRTVYPLYQSLLRLDLGIMLPSLNQFTQLLKRQLLAMPPTFWTRFDLNVSSLLRKGNLLHPRGIGNVLKLPPSALAWMKNANEGFMTWKKSLHVFVESLTAKGSYGRLRMRSGRLPMNVMKACARNWVISHSWFRSNAMSVPGRGSLWINDGKKSRAGVLRKMRSSMN